MRKRKIQQQEQSGMDDFPESTETDTVQAQEDGVTADETDNPVADEQGMHDKYVRLYAEFENYKKRVRKDKEELVKYGYESLVYELLSVIDSLEMALQHVSEDTSSGLVQGVQMTLKELKRIMEKFGLTEIEAEGKPFDPAVHHAMSQVERDDINTDMVVEEYRKGYKLYDKVLRPSFVAVSKKPSQNNSVEDSEEIEITKTIEEEE